MNLATSTFTRECGFHYPKGLDKAIFAVRAGVSAGAVIVTARCLTDSIRAMARQGVQDEIDGHNAYAMMMLAEMLDGLIGALEVRGD